MKKDKLPWFNRRKQAEWMIRHGHTADEYEVFLLDALDNGMDIRTWGFGQEVIGWMRRIEGSEET